MNWREKVKYLIEREENEKPGDPYFYDVCFNGNCWQPGEIEETVDEYPWLPQSYLDFIKEFDGISIAFLRFYGSKNGDAIPLHEEIAEHKPYLKKDYFPFGRDADGSIFIMNHKGEIFWWDEYDYEFEKEPKWLANSLEEFVGDCILGKRYGEFVNIEKNKFYPFLKSEGWA
jgi:hypothetical protein